MTLVTRLILGIMLAAPVGAAYGAQRSMADAEACIARSDFVCAETIFRALYNDPAYAHDRWNLMGNIAFCLKQQSKLDAALDWLVKHLPEAPNEKEEARVRSFIERLVDARREEGDKALAKPDGPTAEVIFRSLLDRPLDDTRRFEIRIRLGRSLMLQARYAEARRGFQALRASATTDENRARLDALIEQTLGDLIADCAPGADSVALEVDGQLGAPRPCPATFTRVEPGPVMLVGTFPTHDDPVRVPAEVLAGQRVTATLTPPPLPPIPWGPALTAGAGGATALAGLGFYFANQSALDELRDDPTNQGRRDTVDTWHALHITCVTVGAAAILGAGTWWYLEYSDRPDPTHIEGTAEPGPQVYLTPFGLTGTF